MLQRYMSGSKGPVFRENSQERLRQEQLQQQQNLSRLSYQQQLQHNQARARDRDERYILRPVVVARLKNENKAAFCLLIFLVLNETKGDQS